MDDFATIATPLGRMVLTVEDGVSRLGNTVPDATQMLPRGGRVMTHRAGYIEATLTLGELFPRLPPGMTVVRCVAAVWRVRTKRPGQSLRFRCEFPELPATAEGGPDPGEGLDALTWVAPEWVVSVGTEDGERLSGRATHHRGMPRELADQLDLGSIAYTPNGMCVPLVDVPVDELVHVQFLAAWAARSGTELDDNNCLGPWFAVDQDPAWVFGELTGETV